MPIDHVHALPPGTRFEEYRLDAVLGAGGFGITYRAYDANLDKFVAIKEYLPSEFATRAERYTVVPQSSTDAQDYHWGLNRFLDEARTLARFKHSHLNQVHRFFESNGTAYMVLEYVEGETLADKLTRDRQLPEESLRRLLEEVLSGLAEMHEAGYVHRDIKPGNLMLREEDGSAVVLDFGAARQAVGQRSKAITSILTPGYAPVEQYDGKVDRVGAWTDIYALGMVAYRCISGISDSELPDAVARMLAHTRGEAVLLPATEAGKGQHNPRLLEAIDWAMEVDEHDRPQTVGEWQRALAGGGRGKGLAGPAGKPTTKPAKAATRRTSMSWSGAVLMLVTGALMAGGAWWTWQHYPEWFGRVTDNVLELTEQAMPADVTGGSPQKTETEETDEAVTDTEEPPQPDTAVASTGGTEPEVEPQATDPAEAVPAEEDEVARLLVAAEANLKAMRLTSPEWNNAWGNYQRILELAPAHPDAIAGMEQVIESYMTLFDAAVDEEGFDKASDYLATIRDLYPDYPALADGAGRLEAAKQAQADRLAKVKAIREFLESFETALRRNALDEAARYLDRIREMDSGVPVLAEAEQRLAEARTAEAARQAEQAARDRAEAARHAEQFEEALREGNLDQADRHLSRVQSLHPAALDVAAAEQRLAGAREAEQERRRQAEEAARKAEQERQRREVAASVKEIADNMVEIPKGRFRMGDMGGDEYDSEKPVHRVTVPAFKMGKFEVTFAQWDACVADGGCGGYRPDDEGWGRGNRPVINVSWDDVQGFIAWLNDKTGGNFRLPTEAEWEYATRAGSTTEYSWGNSIGSNRANCYEDCGDRWESTAPVGSFSANAWGLHDMHGNVSERVQDCYNDSYVGASSDGGAWESGDCSRRVIRGGSWFHDRWSLRSASRLRYARSGRSYFQGFRLAQDK